MELQQFHEQGHYGTRAMVRTLQHQGREWPGMWEECERIIHSCRACLRNNLRRRGFSHYTPILTRQPWEHVEVDLLELPETKAGNRYVLAVVDTFTGFLLLRAQATKTEYETAENLTSVFRDFGVPQVLHSDCGSEFLNHTTELVAKQLWVKHRTGVPFHPRTQGRVENANQQILKLLRRELAGHLSQWDLHLAKVQLLLNLRPSSVTNTEPFALLFGRTYGPRDTSKPEVDQSPEEWAEHLDYVRQVVFPEIYKMRETAARAHEDENRKIKFRNRNKYNVGNLVLLVNPATVGQKLANRYLGPYTIIRKNRGGSVTLQDEDGNVLKRDVNIDQLVKCPTSGQQQLLEILDYRGDGNEREFLVRWKNGSGKQEWRKGNLIDHKLLVQFWRDREGANHYSDLSRRKTTNEEPRNKF